MTDDEPASGAGADGPEANGGGAADDDPSHFVYILECDDGTLYTGYTTDVPRRLKEHNAGTASRYTRGRLPVRLLYFERFSSKSRAMKREAEIKSLRRPAKLEVVGQA